MGRIKKGEDWPELTEENFSIGEANGISRKNVRQRFVNYGYEIERAITEPIRQPKNIWQEWKEVCKQNGVSNELFNRRLVKMSPKEAATMPVGKRGGNSKSLWKDYQEQAEAAGIKRDTFYRRVRKGATPEDAATIPVGKWGEKKPGIIKTMNKAAEKVTKEQRGEIRELWESGQYMQKEIGKMYGISQKTVSLIVNRKLVYNDV